VCKQYSPEDARALAEAYVRGRGLDRAGRRYRFAEVVDPKLVEGELCAVFEVYTPRRFSGPEVFVIDTATGEVRPNRRR
jgi:hypothetical protein